VAVVLTLVQTKQMRINIHKRNTKTQYKQYKNTVQTIQNTVNTSTHITKTPTHTKQVKATTLRFTETYTLYIFIKFGVRNTQYAVRSM
jgi:hypothetical protein